MRKAVFLDRDGTLIQEKNYLCDPAQVFLLPSVLDALNLLRSHQFLLLVITNQSGIGRGYYQEADMHRVHQELNRQFEKGNAKVDGYYFCPHFEPHPDRKPFPGMILRAAQEWNVNLSQSWMIGDQITDAQAGINAGCKESLLVETGHPLSFTEPFPVFPNLLKAVEHICK